MINIMTSPNKRTQQMSRPSENKKVVTPPRPGKRHRQTPKSPVTTTRCETRSPLSKQRRSQTTRVTSPVSAPSSPVTAKDNKSVDLQVVNRERSRSESASPTSVAGVAVPRSYEPPSAVQLPVPPSHWMSKPQVNNQCKDVTSCLVSHLTQTGIMIAAA